MNLKELMEIVLNNTEEDNEVEIQELIDELSSDKMIDWNNLNPTTKEQLKDNMELVDDEEIETFKTEIEDLEERIVELEEELKEMEKNNGKN